MPALRDTILQKAQPTSLRREKVDVPELTDAEIYVREMTAGERDRWDLTLGEQQKAGGLRNVRALAVVMCTVDAGGLPVFAPEDVEQVSQLPATPIDRLYDAIARLSCLTSEHQKELEKN